MATVEATEPRPQDWLERTLSKGVAVNAELLIYLALVVVAVLTRFYDLGARAISHDETTHVYYSWNLYTGRGFEPNPLMHGPLLFHLTAFSYYIFGDNDVAAHVPFALAGVAAVALVWVFRKWLGRTGTLVAAAMMLVSPFMLFYSRYIRQEATIIVEGMLMFWAVFRYFETRRSRWLYLLAFALALHFTDKSTSFIYTAQLMIFLGAMLAWQLARGEWGRPRLKVAFLLGLVSALVGMAAAGAAFIGERAGAATNAATTQAPVNPTGAAVGVVSELSPVVGMGILLAVVGGALMAIALLMAYGKRLRTEFPALDVILLTGTFVLPQLAAFPARMLGWDPIAYTDPSAMQRTGIMVAILAAVSLLIGLAWDWRRWVIASGIFWGIFVTFYTTLFTYGPGFFTGIVGMLGYWLVQQGVNRGSQPWYYYSLIQIPIYEFLPAVGALMAFAMGLSGRPDNEPAAADAAMGNAEDGSPKKQAFPVIAFLGYWSITSLIAYSFAGEKMPWLTVHITLGMILLSGWSIGRFLEAVDWRAFREGRGWLVAILVILLVVAGLRGVGYLLGSPTPFQGSDLEHLKTTTGLLISWVAAAAAAVALVLQTRGWRSRSLFQLAGVFVLAVLFVFTTRAAFRAAYVNYDDATEYLVYAHGATGDRIVLNQIEDLSTRTAGGSGIDVGYDDETSYPFMWYLRNYTHVHFFGASPTRDILNYPVIIAGAGNWSKIEPILGRRYYSFQYTRLWWPMQDYFNLTWQRISNALGSSDYRAALWDIWFNRDYTAYGKLTGVDFSLQNWNPSDRMKLYIRKDVAALLWDYGVRPAALEPAQLQDPYAKGMEKLAAEVVIGTKGSGPAQFTSPRGVAVAADGSVFVADSLNHRIQHLAPDGTPLAAWGTFADVSKGPAPGGTFNEPWGVAVAPDGTVYVADTWNHRIQHFTPDGKFLDMFGTFGQADSPTALWGPRGIAVDSQGRLFVTDTGNKRIVVYDAHGKSIGQFGGAGAEAGQLDEPVGVAVGADGRVYVADTWNQRVQAFQEKEPGNFAPAGEWTIDGWNGQSLDNKPYLAVSASGKVCISDPEGYRVLCFGPDGTFLKGWGDFGTDNLSFGLPVGMAFDGQGKLWVVDSANGRIMRFAPGLP